MSRSKRTVVVSLILLIAIILSCINTSCIRIIRYSDPSTEEQSSSLYATSEIEFAQAILFQGAITDAALRFIDAAMSTDILMKDDQKLEHQEWLNLAEQTMAKWNESEAATARLQEIADILPDYELPTVAQGGMPSLIFAGSVFAAEPQQEDEKQLQWWRSKETPAETRQRKEEEWREDRHKQGILDDAELKVLTAYDKAPPAKNVQTVAKLLGMSNESTQQYLAMLRDVKAKQDYNDAEAVKLQAEYLTYTSQAAATAWFVYGLGGVVAASASATLVNVLTTAVAGGKLAIDWCDTKVTFGYSTGEWVAKIAQLKDNYYVQTASFLLSIRDTYKALGNAKMILDAVKEFYHGQDLPITLEALKYALGKTEIKEKLKEEGVDNLQTLIDHYRSIRDYLNSNPEVKSIELNPVGNSVLVAGDRRTNTVIPPGDKGDVLKATDDLIKVIPTTLRADLSSHQLMPGDYTKLKITVTPPKATDIIVDDIPYGPTGPDGVLIIDYQALPKNPRGPNAVVVSAPDLGLSASDAYTVITTQLRVTVINNQVAPGGVVRLKIELIPPAATMINISGLNGPYYTGDNGLLEQDYPVDQNESPGKCTIYLSAPQFGLNETATYTVIAQQIPAKVKGTLTVGSVPSGADIYIDGRKQAYQTDITLINVDAGKHTVALKKAGYKDYSASAIVEDGKHTELWAKLEPIEKPTPPPPPAPKPPTPTPAPAPKPAPAKFPMTFQWECGNANASYSVYIMANSGNSHTYVSNSVNLTGKKGIQSVTFQIDMAGLPKGEYSLCPVADVYFSGTSFTQAQDKYCKKYTWNP